MTATNCDSVPMDGTMAANVIAVLPNRGRTGWTDDRGLGSHPENDAAGVPSTGDLTSATSALATWIAYAGPWPNAGLAWRRCVAAGLAVDMLVADGGRQDARDTLVFNALLHPLCRMAVGAAYPKQYLQLARRCRQRGETLDDHQTTEPSHSHGEVVERILRYWGLPPVVCEPLMYLGDTYESLAGLAEPLRTNVELLKLSVVIGRLAVREWESEDRVEIPPSFVIKRSRCHSLPAMVQRVAAQMAEMVTVRPQPRMEAIRPSPASGPSGELTYCNLSPQPIDFVAEIVSSMGIRLISRELGDLKPDENVLVNCLWAYPHRIAEKFGGRSGEDTRLIVTDVVHRQPCSRYGRVLTLPASYGSLRQACRDLAGQPSLASRF